MRFVLIFSWFCIYYIDMLPQIGFDNTNYISTTTEGETSRCIFGVYEYGISTKDRVFIVNRHNEYRKLISKNMVPNQPGGVDLMKMRYDSYLAIKAQQSADKCRYDYDSSCQNDSPIGQNLFMTMSASFEDKPNWTEALHSWFSQHDLYLFGGSIQTLNRHYVQMIWAKTTRIGCGYVAFPLKRGHFMFYRYYICNYLPGLNPIDVYPYKTEVMMPNTPCYEPCN
ncbi:hypothetical protein WA026_019716 [Henosepilachna vigintioctopunctata]|uniref:SCP domain-containing protein n=1 Tax=Henosepilachna vigintioctopunctata TaxID=420089 RepID=A0AAW1UN24_9CUCU